ncbi:MAG: VOC family protein [Chloroflexi bacterium]|nr:VOC family protein [Chloroflexota bacterium]
MVSVLAYDHATIVVGEMERSLAFYRDFLGLATVLDEVLSGSDMDKLFGGRGVQLRRVKLQTDQPREPNKRFVELIQFYAPAGKPYPKDVWACDLGFPWVGIPLKDVEALYDNQPPSFYHRFTSPPVKLGGGRAVSFCADPDGMLVELTSNDHLSRNVSDINKALAFYRDLLGLREPPDAGAFAPTTEMDEVQRCRMWFSLPKPDVKWTNVWSESQLAARNGRLELGIWTFPKGKTFPVQNLWDVGTRWAGLQVADLTDAHREMTAKRVTFVSAPVSLTTAKVCLCRDPDGNPIELFEK